MLYLLLYLSKCDVLFLLFERFVLFTVQRYNKMSVYEKLLGIIY